MNTASYDGNGNLTKTTDANGECFYYKYDALDNVIMSYSESNQAPTIYQYDKKGQKIKEILPSQHQRVYEYDGNGNLTIHTDEESNKTVYEYNLFDQPSSIAYADDRKVIYRYNKAGQLVELRDWNGATLFESDALGRLTKLTDHNGYSVTYSYDKAGNKLSMLYPDNSIAKYAYYRNNQLKSVTDAGGTSTDYTYYLNGDIKKISQANGNTTEYVYNSIGALKNLSYFSKAGQRLSRDYKWDPTGNIVSVMQSGSCSGLSNAKLYSYDKINQLISYTEDGLTVKYEYDGSGNRVKELSFDGTETVYNYNNLNP